MSLEHGWEVWPPNVFVSGTYIPVDPTKTWVPSPTPRLFPEPFSVAQSSQNPIIPNVKAWQAYPKFKKPKSVSREEAFPRRSWLISPQRWKKWFSSKFHKRPCSAEDWPSLRDTRRATTSDWIAYGHWARPTINGVIVRNATPPPDPQRLTPMEVEALMQSLNNASGSDPHPERWIARLEHHSLPPRPEFWRIIYNHPDFRIPPSQVQLNPILEHRLLGTQPIRFDIRSPPEVAALGEVPPIPEDPLPGLFFFNVWGPNGAQQATNPSFRRLHVSGIADDPVGRFPWPFTITSAHEQVGITVVDVMDAIYCNFQELVTEEEFRSLDQERKEQVERAFHVRQELRRQIYMMRKFSARPLEPPSEDGIRRVDYLGDRYIFRGMEASPDDSSFIIFFGPP